MAADRSYRAVIFDIGGVVVGSPLHAIARYEQEHGLPPGFINRLVSERGEAGAWARLERGELTLEQFYPIFERECAEAGGALSTREIMRRIDAVAVPRAEFFEAIRRIRQQGLLTAALTNNWLGKDRGTARLRSHFDVFVESAVMGIRKPDPRIYRRVCEALEVEPGEAIFLDDIGRNLKPARALGMKTIRVEDPDRALRELEAMLGFGLLA